MPRHLTSPTRTEAVGEPAKHTEFVGRVNSETDAVSIARMVNRN